MRSENYYAGKSSVREVVSGSEMPDFKISENSALLGDGSPRLGRGRWVAEVEVFGDEIKEQSLGKVTHMNVEII